MAPTLAPGERVVVHYGGPWSVGSVVVVDRGQHSEIKRVERIEGSHVFVVGDNPAASTDSRHYGAVTANDVLGRAMLRLPSRHSRLPQRL